MRTNKGNYKHGKVPIRLYRIWKSMRQRCKDPNCRIYKRYGGRGIEVCDEWNDYAVFRTWALSNGYEDTLSIDRIDNNKGYSPENCRWVTNKVQQNNRRNNRIIEAFGERHTMAEWADITGISYSVIQARLGRGWFEEDAVSHPLIRGSLKKNEQISRKKDHD